MGIEETLAYLSQEIDIANRNIRDIQDKINVDINTICCGMVQINDKLNLLWNERKLQDRTEKEKRIKNTMIITREDNYSLTGKHVFDGAKTGELR